ncbi:MAG: hypothetical protein PHF00_08475, partial [Elusimicrobia bacterium]|nr:hypothetical protein [Elusimicrobiota bacterium]
MRVILKRATVCAAAQLLLSSVQAAGPALRVRTVVRPPAVLSPLGLNFTSAKPAAGLPALAAPPILPAALAAAQAPLPAAPQAEGLLENLEQGVAPDLRDEPRRAAALDRLYDNAQAAADSTAEVTEPDKSVSGIWSALEGWIREELGLKLAPGKAEAWAAAAASALRQEPDLTLEKALAASLAAVQPSAANSRANVAALLAGERLVSGGLDNTISRKVIDVIHAGGRTYALVDFGGVYIREGRSWKRLPISANGSSEFRAA